jgi:crotonobetainyl-CoA:carnitine CoA-transferase CaiB-like acyl-CoA transferase
VEAVFQDPQILAQHMLLDIAHPGHGVVRMLGFPMKLSATPCQVRRPAPALGQHSDEILVELDFSAAERDALRQEGVI